MSANGEGMPEWMVALDADDRQFLRRFVLGSGSLKDLATEYGVSYPTVRARLDRLIAKVKAAEDPRPADSFERRLRLLVAEGTVSANLGKQLLDAHRDSLQRRTS